MAATNPNLLGNGAQIKMDIERLRSVLKQAALRPDNRYVPIYDKILLQITQEKVDVFGRNTAKSVISYNTYRGQYFDDIRTNSNQSINVVLDPCWILKQIHLIQKDEGSNDDVLMEITRGGKNNFGSSIQIHADLTLKAACPTANKVKNQFPVGIRNTFNQNDRFQPSGNSSLTIIEGCVDNLLDIVDLVEKVGLESAYPIQVKNGEFRIDAQQKGNSVKGKLSCRVKGPDFKNHYADPFKLVAETLDEGPVSLQSAADQNLAIVQNGDDHTVRNVIAQVTSP